MAKEHYLGIDLGGTNIQAGVMDAKHKLIARGRTKTKADQGSDTVLERLCKLADEVLDEAKLKRSDVAAAGIGAPGAIDVKTGTVITAVNLRWDHFPLSSKLSKMLDMPVIVDNDVNVGAWGEYKLGAAQGSDEMLAMFVGTGVGGGLVLGGKLYHGVNLTAGEIGHTVVDADAPLGRSTLENLASRTSIVNQLTQLIRANHPSVINDITKGNLSKIRSKVLAEAIEKKDPLTTQIVQQAAVYVGTAAANTVTLLSLPCVVLGGGLTDALGDTWVKMVRASFDQRVFPPELRKCKIVAGTLGDDAGILGAALLAQAETVLK